MEIYESSSLPWPGNDPVDYGYDIESVAAFAKYANTNHEFIKVVFPNGKSLKSWECASEEGPYLVLFNQGKKIWQSERRALAKEVPVDNVLFEASDNSTEAIYDVLHNYCVRGKNVYIKWNDKTLYSVDASYVNRDKNLLEINSLTPEEYARNHPNINTFGAEYVTSAGLSDDEAIKRIVQANKDGLTVYTRIPPNGLRVYSAWSPTFDDAYRQAFPDCDIKKKELAEKNAKIRMLYTEGLSYIEPLPDPGEWRECLDINCKTNDDIEMMTNIVGAMKAFSNKDWEGTAAPLRVALQKNENKPYSIIKHFCPKAFEQFLQWGQEIDEREGYDPHTFSDYIEESISDVTWLER